MTAFSRVFGSTSLTCLPITSPRLILRMCSALVLNSLISPCSSVTITPSWMVCRMLASLLAFWASCFFPNAICTAVSTAALTPSTDQI